MNSIRKYLEGESWSLGTKSMPLVESTSHMGILRTSSNQDIQEVISNIQKARRTIHSLMALDFTVKMDKIQKLLYCY